MKAVKKSMIVIGTAGGFALFLWSVYRLFNAKLINALSFVILVAGVALLACGIASYVNCSREQKKLEKKNPGAKSAYLKAVDDVVGFGSRVRPVLIMLLVAAVFSCMHPRFLTMSNFLNILKQNSHYGILAAGVCFAILLGGIDISVGSVLAFSGAVAALIISTGGSVIFAILAAIAIGAVAGLMNGVFIARFKLQPMIVTLATMSIFRGATLVLTNGKSISLGKLAGSGMFKAIGQGSLGFLPVPVLLLIVTYAVVYYILNMTSFGRHVYAIGGNEEAARLSGINVERTKTLAHLMSGLLAGVAGILVTARVASATPTAGDGYEMDAIAAAVIGGISLRGGEGQVLFTIVGAVIIGMLNNILNLMNVSSYYQTIIKGVVILIAVLLDAKSKEK